MNNPNFSRFYDASSLATNYHRLDYFRKSNTSGIGFIGVIQLGPNPLCQPQSKFAPLSEDRDMGPFMVKFGFPKYTLGPF